MSNPIRIRRRTSGATGSPSSLLNAELAFNEVDNTLYYGYGDVAGAASSILAIGGPGAFATLTSCQTISGDKTFTGSLNAVTQANATNSNLVATTAFVTNKLANLTNVVNGFNNRTGNVTLTSNDVTTALGYSPLTPLANITHANGTIIYTTNRIRGEVQVYTEGLFTKKQYSGFYSTANGAEPTSYRVGLACLTTSTGGLTNEHYLDISGEAGVFLGSGDQATGAVGALTTSVTGTSLQFTPGSDYSFQRGELYMIAGEGQSPLTGNSTFTALVTTMDGDSAGIQLSNNGTHALASLLMPSGCLTLLYDANSILSQGYADSRYVPQVSANTLTITTLSGSDSGCLTLSTSSLTFQALGINAGSLTFSAATGLTMTSGTSLPVPTNAGDFIYLDYADDTYVPFNRGTSINIASDNSTNAVRLDLDPTVASACLTAGTVSPVKLDLDGLATTALLTGVDSWEANSILTRGYADTRYLPVNGTGTIANLTVTGNLTAVTQANSVSSNLVATTAYVSNRITEIQNTANGAYVPISSSTTSTVTSTDGFSVSRLTLNGSAPAACLTSTNNSGTALSLLLDPPTGQVTLTGMTSWVANSVLTRSYADSRYIQSTANGSVSDLTVGGDLVVTGNLTVNGNTTTLNSVTLTIDDKNIELGSIANATNVTADGGGLTLKGTTDKSLIWYNATSSWTSSENLSLVTGKSYRINDVVVLSNTALGNGVTGSCLTSVGTISTGVWQGSTVGVAYGGTGAITLTGYVKGSGTSALTACATIPGADISGNITGNAAGLTGTLTVAFGGTGAVTLTSGSYLKGNGTGAITSSSTIPVGDLSGTLSVAGGGTGVTTLTSGSYVKGNGTGGLTTSATIPGSDVSGNITGNAAGLTTTLTVGFGGTGTTTLTSGSYLKGNGTGAITSSSTIPVGDLSGTLSVAGGGTGVTTLTSGSYVKGNGTGGLTTSATIPGSDISGNITGNAAGLTGTLTVAFGGTGVVTLTSGSYLKGNGTGAITTSSTIPVGDLSGTLSVAGGGTGAVTLTGYVKGSGTSALTASSTIPGADISGNITGNAAGLTGTLAVGFGGTGTTTLTSGSYLKGNGTGAITTSSTIPVGDLSGTLSVSGGGTGVATFTSGSYVKGNGTGGLTTSATIPGSDISGNITGNAAGLTGTLTVAFGGTGVATLTSGSYLKGNGTGAITTSATIPGSDISGNITGAAGNVTGIVAVVNGGTGVATITGLIKGNGTSAFVAATAGTDYLSPSSTIDGGTF